MSFLVKQKIKGTTYVYETKGKWDKEKKQCRHERVLIGKLDPDTGEIIPSKKLDKPNLSKDYGNYYFLNTITKTSGLENILTKVFPDNWQEILTCAFYELCEKNPMYLCEEWNDLTVTPFNETLSSQRISKLFQNITTNDRMEFFKKWGKYRSEQEYIAFDITSISSYSNLIKMVEIGYNRDGENLPQINLGMLFGEKSLLPVYYNLYPGSIKDVKTLSNMLKITEFLEMKKIKFVMDKGFYSKNNIDEMINKPNNYKFAVAVPFSSSFAKSAVESIREKIELPSNTIMINNEIIQAVTINQKWNNNKIFVHVYFNKEKYSQDEKEFLKKILLLEQELLTGNRIDINEEYYEKYFIIRNLKSGIKIQRNDEKIMEKLKYKGYFVIISNDIKKADEALRIYRNKDVVEKSFDNLKNDLDLNRLRIHSDKALEGRIFIGFIALILQSYIHKTMKDKELYKEYTKEKLLCEMKKIKKIQFASGKTIITEISKKQRDIFTAFTMPLPD